MLGNCLQSSSEKSSPKTERSEKVLGHTAYSHCSNCMSGAGEARLGRPQQ